MNDRTILHIKDIVHETPDAITIRFAQPDPPFNYLPGQFLTLISKIDGKEERRAYSLCSSPYVDKDLAVTVKRVKGGKMSNYLHDHIHAGDEIAVLPPAGNFCYTPGNGSRHIVLIGGGSGITPLFSIIKSVLTEEAASRVSLIYVNSNRANTILYEQLEEWSSWFSSRFRIVHYWSDEWEKKQLKPGFFSRLFGKANAHRINSARLKAIFNDLQITGDADTRFYLCGPQKLMEMVTATILAIGFSKEVIHKESFYTAVNGSCKPTGELQDRRIKIRLKGKEHEVDVPAGTPVLFAGLDAGLNLPYSCQSGNCTSCAGKCLSGEVEMSTTEGLTDQQLREGYVLACVGYPKTDDVVIEFG